MKKLISFWVLLSLLGASIEAQEKKAVNFKSSTEKFVWDVISPVYTIEGDTITYLEIVTVNKIEAISFCIEWHLKGGTIISTTEKSVLRHGSIPWTNDLPKVFPASLGIWYNLYMLPGPPVSVWDVEKIRFSGRFLTGKIWNNMGLNEALCHNK